MKRIISFFQSFLPGATSVLAVAAALVIVSACTPKEEEAIDEIVIDAVTPSTGDVTGGYPIVITGSGFTFIERVTVGGTSCPVTTMEATSITCTAPANAAGAVTVKITGKADRSASGSFTYEVVTPTFDSVTPAFGNPAGGTRIYVSGTGFNNDTRVFMGPITYDGDGDIISTNECDTPIVYSPTYLACSSPILAQGLYDLVILNANGGTDTEDDAFTVYPAPTFTSISPAIGPTSGGTTVTITGSGFVAGVRVQFGTASCSSTTRVSSTQITCRTPARPDGNYAVRITNPDLQTVVQNNAYDYNDTATILAVTPVSGAVAGGTRLTVYGTSFTSATAVTINGVTCTRIGSFTSTMLQCDTGGNPVGVYGVVVQNPGTTAATLLNGFTYQEAPTLASVSPTSGPAAAGSPITITGNYFRTGVAVTVGTAACAVTARTLTSITCTLAAGSAGAQTITVTNSDNQSITGLTYTRINAPSLATATPVTPAVVASSGGPTITITGLDFQSIPVVKIGTDDCDNEALASATSITCEVPAKTAGQYPITVTNPDGQTVTSTGNVITFLDAPTVTAISPSAGALAGGTNLTVTGTNFFTGAVVRIGGTACTSTTFNNALSVTCVGIPPSAIATAATVRVENADGQFADSLDPYDYQLAPTTTSINPTSGVIAGGYTVVVSGANFLTGATVKLGTLDCGTPTVDEALDTITCLVPAAPSGSGTVAVVVTNPDGQVSGAVPGGFRFTPPPSATAVTPTAAPTGSLQRLTITGTDFDGSTVTVGADACAIVSVTPTEILCDVTVAAAGLKTITVTNSDTQPDTLTGITFMDTPTIASVSPTNGRLSGGTSITVSGTNFYAGATVTINGLACTSPVVDEPADTVTCTTPANEVGSPTLVVRNADAQTASSTFTYNPLPTITSFTPTSGGAGTVVTITGTNFITGSVARIGSTACATTTFVSATSVTCAVPPGTGASTISVTNPDTQAATSSGSFTYVPAPTVVSISPSIGKSAGNTLVTITGANFQSGATVSIGGTTCGAPTFVNATTLTCTTALTAAGSYPVTVLNPDQQSGTSVTNIYTFEDPPTIASVSPDVGAVTGGTLITITGTNFSASTTVSVGGVNCGSLTVVSDTEVTCRTPGGAAGGANVVVSTNDGMSATDVGGYTFRLAPVITSVSPSIGPVGGGITVTISGSNFVGDVVPGVGPARVVFDATAVTACTWVDLSTITCPLPVGTAGTKTVSVFNGDGQSASLYPGVTYLAAPTVTAISPSFGSTAGGGTVTITGTNFFSGATVTMGGACTGVTVVNATTITCTRPGGALGATNVTVTNVDNQNHTLVGGYTYLGPPTVSVVTPNNGPIGGGNTIVLTGTNFRAGATVRLVNGTAVFTCTSVAVASDTSLSCVVPAATAASYTVSVTNTDSQSGSLASGYRYRATATISSVSPSTGRLAGGHSVTVTGTGFETGDTVRIGSVLCTSTTFVSATQLTCMTPAQASGLYAVSVVYGGGTVTRTSAFTYLPAPTVSAISPVRGFPTGGTLVTITGTNFLNGATVQIDGNSCSGVSVLSTTSLRCTTPAGIGATDPVVVTNPDLQASGSTVTFSYENFADLAFLTGTTSPTPPNPDSYGSTTTNVTHTFTLINNGNVDSTGITLAIGGTNASAFSLNNTCSATLMPGSTCTFQVTFLGGTLAAGTYNAVINAEDDSLAAPVTNLLSGVKP
jgi:hypothetical protein